MLVTAAKIRMTEAHYQEVHRLLFPGDRLEAMAFLLCRRAYHEGRCVLLVNQVHCLPAEAYLCRDSDRVQIDNHYLLPLLDKAEQQGYSVVKCHSHPGGAAWFSDIDDRSDRDVVTSFYQWQPDGPHASLVMSDDDIGARIVDEEGGFHECLSVVVVGHQIRHFGRQLPIQDPQVQDRMIIAFGEETYRIFGSLTFGVVGASGTGGLTIESLYRTGAGGIVAIDPEILEAGNLNRVLHSRLVDAVSGSNKVHIAQRNIQETGLGTRITALPIDLKTEEAMRQLAWCDVLVGCVDKRGPRLMMNRLSAFYLMPYIDMGVRIDESGDGDGTAVSAAVHYFRPGQSFVQRGIFTYEDVRAEQMALSDPEHYQEQLGRGYVRHAQVTRPAVMPLNMVAAGLGVMEILARIHSIRDHDQLDQAAETFLSLNDGILLQRSDEGLCPSMSGNLGLGDVTPLLNMPVLSSIREAA